MARRTRGQRGSRSRNRAVNPVRIGTGIGNQLSAPLRGVLQNHAVHARESNPTTQQYVIGGAVLAATGVAAYFLLRDDTPAAPQGGGGGLEGGMGPGNSPDVCGLGPGYPAFAWDSVQCVPTQDTPPGIYIIDDCQDFIFVTGDDGPQPDDLEARIANGVRASKRFGGIVDPTNIATSFLGDWWAECAWPPAPDAAPRIVQMYMALSIMIGRLILAGGGKVFGASTMEDADELIGDRFIQLGYDDFLPDIVSEIPLPDPNDATLDPDVFDDGMIDAGGLDFDEDYIPPQGGIGLPPGGGGPFQPPPQNGQGWDEVPPVNLPDAFVFERDYAMEDKDVVVPMTNIDGLPDGIYYVRLVFTATFRAPQTKADGTFAPWNMTNYGQQEIVDYQITVNGPMAMFEKIGEQAGLPNTAGPNQYLFGCTFVSQCGFNGEYNSYFEPRLGRNDNSQLILMFRTRALVDMGLTPIEEALIKLNVEATVSFSNDAP